MYFPDLDTRACALLNWLRDDLLLSITQFAPASSDASFRRYFRVIHRDGQHIVMDAPPDKENTAPFIRIAQLFRTAGLNTPRIHAENLSDGFLLLDDLGSQSFLDVLNPDTAHGLYQAALDSLFLLQTRLNAQQTALPCYDRPLLQRELGIFHEWFLQNRLNLHMPAAVKSELENQLIESALEQPQTVVHRDYHSRNLMHQPQQAPGVIDFQDAVIGPISYDLVSLLRDCYIAWPDEQVHAWLTAYAERLQQAGLISADLNTFKRWFDWMGLQRHLKAIGIFSRLDLRDGKSGYLADIPRTLNYVAQVAAAYPELASFNHYLHTTILPAYHTAP